MTERMTPLSGNAWEIGVVHKSIRLLMEAQALLEAADLSSQVMDASFDAILTELDRMAVDASHANGF